MQQSWETLLQSALCVATSTPSSLPSTPKPCSVDSSQGTLPDLDEDPTMLHTIPTPQACAGTMQDCYEELEAKHHVLIQEYTLHYPWECVPRAFSNACDGQTEGDIIVWLDSFNVLGCPKLRRKMERLESNSFGAFTCPSVSGLHAARMGRFFALFVLCDDAVVEPAAEFGVTFDQLQVFVDAVLAAGKQDSFEHFAANAPAPLAVVVNGIPLGNIARMWFEFVKQYLNDGASQEWLKRFADAVATYLHLGLQEANMTSSLQQSWERDDVFAVPSDASNTKVLRTIFQQRIAAIGVPMMALLLERACNVDEVTWREVFSPWVDEAIDHVAIASFLVNDLYGLARDIVRNEHCFNDMLLVARFKKLSAMQGVQFAISLHDSAVDHVVALTVDRSNEPSALDFSHALRFLVRGYGQWHAHCSRYRECVAISSSCALTFVVQDEAKSITKHLC